MAERLGNYWPPNDACNFCLQDAPGVQHGHALGWGSPQGPKSQPQSAVDASEGPDEAKVSASRSMLAAVHITIGRAKGMARLEKAAGIKQQPAKRAAQLHRQTADVASPSIRLLNVDLKPRVGRRLRKRGRGHHALFPTCIVPRRAGLRGQQKG